jgi:hypothetical protein
MTVAKNRFNVNVQFACNKDISSYLPNLESLVLNVSAKSAVDAVLLCKSNELEVQGSELAITCKTTAQAIKDADAAMVAQAKLVDKQQSQIAALKAEITLLKKQLAKSVRSAAKSAAVAGKDNDDLFGAPVKRRKKV